MKYLPLLCLVIAFFSDAKAYEVENARQQGFVVNADDYVYITTPDNKRIQVTQIPFVGDDYSIPPVEPILCTWDPSQTWLGIFITVKQTTEIHLFNLKTRTMLTAETDWSSYPDWFGKPQIFAHTKPVKWNGNKLLADTLVKFRDGTTRRLPETLIVNGDVFQIVPEER